MNAARLLILSAGLALPVLGQPADSSDLPTKPLARERAFPSPGATEVNPDTPLMLVFAKASSVAGTGTVTVHDAADDRVVATIDLAHRVGVEDIGGIPGFNYRTLTFDGREVTFHLPIGALAYGRTYYVTFDSGLFKDGDVLVGGAQGKSAWSFTTKASPPADKSTYLVAADGSGDFSTIQGAVDRIPDGNTRPRTIDIAQGYYEEIVAFTNKHNLTFRGEDKDHTVLAYANNAAFNDSGNPYATGGNPSSVVHVKGRIYHRGVFLAHRCNGLVLINLTIENTTPHGGTQAEAVILNGTMDARALIVGVNLYSFQDTLQVNGQAFVLNTYVQGDVDFLWGTGPCFFENCRFRSMTSGGYYTQVRNPATNHGFVFLRCSFDGTEGVERTYLSRIEPDRFPASEVVLIHCQLGPNVIPAGWLLQKPKGSTEEPKVPEALHFWEIDSQDLTGQPANQAGRMAGSRQMDATTDTGTADQYSLPAFVLNGWNPRIDPLLSKR